MLEQVPLFTHVFTKETQTAKILRLLKKHGELTNYQLNRIAFRYSARLYELRREGHVILTVCEKGSLRRFIYKGDGED